MIKKILAAVLFLSGIGFSQTSTLTGHLIDPSNTPTTTKTLVHFELISTGGNTCRIAATGIVAPTTKDVSPNGSGVVSASLIRNDQLVCGSTLGGSRWKYTITRNGISMPACVLNVITATVNLDTTACINATPTPVATVPADSVYARLDGTNAGFTGPVSFGSSLTVTGASTLAGVTATSVNAVQNTTGAGADCGLSAAYTALPSTGGTLTMSGDCAISASQTITLTANKPVHFDFGWHKITCSNTTGSCLTISMPASGTFRWNVTIDHLTMQYSGASTSINGMTISNTTGVSLKNVTFNNFVTSGSCGLNLQGVQDSSFDDIDYNMSSLCTGVNTIQDGFNNNHFQGDGVTVQPYAMSLVDSMELTFTSCLVEAVKATQAVQIFATTTNIHNINFINCHFEDNGDTTANTRDIFFTTAAGKQSLATAIIGGTFNKGALGGSLIPIGQTGAGAGATNIFISGVVGSGITQWFDAGFGNGASIDSFNNSYVDHYNVGLDTNGNPGISFNPIGATKAWQIFGGYPGNFDGFWVFHDVTANQDILSYNSNTWSMLRGTLNLGTANSIGGVINMFGATSGSINFSVPAIAGSNSVTWGALSGTPLLDTAIQSMTNKTVTSPVINGTPTGTGIPTVTLKKGSGAGNYTTASTTYVVTDATNLCYTVTIPTGWKLLVNTQAEMNTATAAVTFFLALTDNAACSTANAGLLAETTAASTSTSTDLSVSLTTAITGDGAAHNIALQYKTSNGADSATVVNSTATRTAMMTFLLTPSN